MKQLLFIVLLATLASCFEGMQRIEAPKNLIGREKMIEVMTELVKLEGHIQDRWPGVNRFHKAMTNSGDSLFKAHNITFEQFDASMDYYGSRQKEMQDMYSEVLERLGQELGELQAGE